MTNRFDIIYKQIDQMVSYHGKPRPKEFGGGLWNFDREVKTWRREILGHEIENGYVPLTRGEWKLINTYIKTKRKEIKR